MRRNNRLARKARLSKRERLDARRQERPRGPPSWYEDDSSPCDHIRDGDADPETVRSVTGYSDFHYMKKKCPVCGETYCSFIEG